MAVFIIAEIGINHNGDMNIAKQLIDMAKQAGCDAVKFQKRTVELVYPPAVLDAARESPWGTTQRHQKEGLELNKKEYIEIDNYCKEKQIPWFASAFDIESQIFLRPFNCLYNKIASCMLTHASLLNTVAEEKKPTFISTGMSTWEEIDEAVGIFQKHNCPFTLMHCVSAYPAHDEHTNLQVIPLLQKRYGCKVGYSGHEVGILPSVLAVSVGATAIERHITLDRTLYGSDQAASLERRGLELLVRDARSVWAIMGNGVKEILPQEWLSRKKLRYFESSI